jgi:hypothetical protein
MLLTPNEREIIASNVADLLLQSPGNLFALVKAHATRINQAQPPIEYGYNVVDYCILSGWVENPALIFSLLKRFEILPEIQAAIARLHQIPKPVFHYGVPSNTCLVALRLPFIGREITRKAIDGFFLSQQTLSSNSRVLIANGKSGSGKTFTYSYIMYINLVYTLDVFQVIYIDFKVLQGGRFGPRELARTIFELATIPNFNPPELDAQQPARWNLQLAKYVAQTLNSATSVLGNRRKFWVIALDQFNDDSVPIETIELIQLLATIATGELAVSDYQDCIRVVILGFDDPISNFNDRVVNEDIQLITKIDLEMYFKRYCEFKQIEPNPAMLTMLADKVLQNDPGDIPERNNELARWALTVAETL